jgi:hypothetical protein
MRPPQLATSAPKTFRVWRVSFSSFICMSDRRQAASPNCATASDETPRSFDACTYVPLLNQRDSLKAFSMTRLLKRTAEQQVADEADRRALNPLSLRQTISDNQEKLEFQANHKRLRADRLAREAAEPKAKSR